MRQLLDQLQELPDSWGLVVCDAKKRPYQTAWQSHPLTKSQAAAEINAGRAKAIGVIAGETSGGLLFLDHDGISATAELQRLGIPPASIPKSVMVTSGRDGRFQLLLTIPQQYWPSLRNRRVFATGAIDADGKAENLDLRWNGHQSIVIGHHPSTGAYKWITGRSPADIPVAEAPTALIELLLKEPDPLPTLLTPTTQHLPSTLPFLDFISRDSRDLIESGGTPGSWNDDHLRLSLDLKGTESWIIAQGHHPDITARDAFASHIAAARTKSRDFDERKAWHRFDGADAHNPTPSTPPDKLADRLRFHTRTQRPALPQSSPQPSPPELPEPPPKPTFDKPTKLEANELLIQLRAQSGRIRFNTFSQQIELDGSNIEGIERFYLQLAQQGYKVSKELAVDCLVQIAQENLYDPVTLYLEHVAATVEPAYIGGLATAYLRPSDAGPDKPPTLYDEMLRCTLIGAVRRAFEPGCKHDTATVLMGDQGARKSSFWSALGGPFFSDALGDCTSKDDLMILHRSWIMEWAELDSIMGRRHAGQVKAFLSQSTDLFRVPYGKSTEAFPRRGIIVGSTNRSTGFLQDDTGNRRFWVIPTTCTESNPIDTATLCAERDAIWAAAVIAYRNGEPNYLPPELALQVTAENLAYQVENPWKAPIASWLAEPKNQGVEITSELLLTQAVGKPTERQTRADQMQISAIMAELGYSKARRRIDGTLRWVFHRP
jgi:predicted P-loop ATPase